MCLCVCTSATYLHKSIIDPWRRCVSVGWCAGVSPLRRADVLYVDGWVGVYVGVSVGVSVRK